MHLLLPTLLLAACTPPGDGGADRADDTATGDSADSGTIGDSDDSGDSGDSGETADSGDSGKEEPTPERVVDIYVSAGDSVQNGEPVEGDTCEGAGDCPTDAACVDRTCTVPADAWESACNRDDVSSCKVYAVTFALDTMEVRDVRLALDPVTDLPEGSSILFPRVSPDNTMLAMEVRDRAGPGVVQVCRLTTRECATVSLGPEHNLGRYPAWIGETDLFFSLETDPYPAWSDTWGVTIDPAGREPSPVADASIVLGEVGTPAGADTSEFAFAGPYAFVRDETHFLATHGNWPAPPPCRDEHGEPADEQDCVFNPSSIPAVWDIDAGVGQPVSLDLPDIEDPWACAHVAVSPEGDRLVCTVQETYADTEHVGPDHVYGYPYLTGADINADGVADALVRQYFPLEFAQDESDTWVSTTGREMFTIAGPAELEAIDPRFAQSDCATPGMSVWVHKYTSYCGDADHVVTAVWCEGPTELGAELEDAPNKVIHSSVFVIDIHDRGHPVYVDLGQALEAAMPEISPADMLESASAMCSAPYEVVDE